MDERTDRRADGQRERRADMTKLIVGFFRNFENAPKNK